MSDEVKLPELELVALGEELTCEHAAYRAFISHGPSKYCCYICYLLRDNDAATQRRDFLELLTCEHEAQMITMREMIQEAISQRDELLARVKVLEDALRKIEAWELPASGKFWPKEQGGQEMHYQTAFGTNGSQKYFRELASAALAPHVEGQGGQG